MGRGAVGKTAVVGMRERGGRTIAMPLQGTDGAALHSAIHANVEVGSTIFTDDHAGYVGLGDLLFRHSSVNHTDGVYSHNGVSTNGIESVWAVLKRGVYGVYHQVSKKHLRRYVDEFTFRLNAANVSRHTLERLDSFVCAIAGKRMTYKELTA